jgi:hypothetical protein
MKSKLVTISDFHRVVGVLLIPKELDIQDLREEYESILDPGENPFAYDTPQQTEWIERVQKRESYLVSKYGGAPCGGSISGSKRDKTYGPETFIGWLVKEKGARKLSYCDYLMAEFD